MAGDLQFGARRFFVSGSVQGVGYRYFTQRAAGRLGLSGFVRNLRDGRVEVFAAGPLDRLAALKSELERGPSGAFVSAVAEEPAAADPRYAANFVVEFTSG
ncbi:MAG TPA: acylphosphatase [Verrucomicrobiae bacterium]|nr:acylphosphatase [Verrucomicrobiae bacterium]